MSGSLNKVTIIGTVGKDPEIRSFNNGGRVANFSIATSESWKDKATGEKKEKTEWHKISVWNDGLVGVIEKYVRKGQKVYIEGALQTRKYEKDGVDHYTTEIVLKGFDAKLLMLSNPKDKDKSEPAQHKGFDAQGDVGQAQNNLDDEIPF
jgi:single-strand DNA-binding protein